MLPECTHSVDFSFCSSRIGLKVREGKGANCVFKLRVAICPAKEFQHAMLELEKLPRAVRGLAKGDDPCIANHRLDSYSVQLIVPLMGRSVMLSKMGLVSCTERIKLASVVSFREVGCHEIPRGQDRASNGRAFMNPLG